MYYIIIKTVNDPINAISSHQLIKEKNIFVGHPGIIKGWETLTTDWSCKSGYWKMKIGK